MLDGGRRLIAADPVPDAGDVFAVIPPRAVALHRQLPDGSPRNVWKGSSRTSTSSATTCART